MFVIVKSSKIVLLFKKLFVFDLYFLFYSFALP